MPGRTLTSISAYRYGFNGMEKDDEMKGNGNSYSTEYREYDSRIGRWFSADPLFMNFPWQSPYVAFDNNPIVNTDPRGDAADGDGKGQKRATEATSKVATDTRVYGQNDSKKLDCSKATNEISTAVGDNAFKGMKGSYTAISANQAEHLKKTGEFSTDIKDAQVGDYIFWSAKSDKTIENISHVGIITKIEDGVISVASAECAGAKCEKGVWSGGKESFNIAKLSSDGGIWRNHKGEGGKNFVGLGRPKLAVTTAKETKAAVITVSDATKYYQQASDMYQKAKEDQDDYCKQFYIEQGDALMVKAKNSK
jgi:RHS repeat-associated protein